MQTVVPPQVWGRAAAWRPSRRVVHLVIPGVLGVCWLAVVLTRLPLPYPSDQLNYFNAAAAFPHGVNIPGALHQVTRFGLVIPVRLAIAVFGYSEAAYHVVPLLGTLAVLAATYALGAMLFNPVVGGSAAIVVVTAMPMFRDAGALLPDEPATGLFTFAVVLALAVRRGRLRGRWPLLAIGALLAWSYAIREFIIFAWPVIPLILAPDRRLRALFSWAGARRIGWVAAPVVAYLVGEALLMRAMYGSPVAREFGIMHQKLSPFPSYPGQPRVAYLIQLPLTLIHQHGSVWLAGLIGALLLGGLVWRRRLALPLAWCGLIWVTLSLAGGVLQPDDPALRLNLIRYWFALFPPLAVGGLGALWLAGVWLTGRVRAARADRPDPGRTGSRRAALARTSVPALVLLVIAGCAAGTSIAASGHDSVIGTGNGRWQMAAFRGWMTHQAGSGALWADIRTGLVARVYRQAGFGGRRWPNPIHSVSVRDARLRPHQGDLVVLFDDDDGTACGVCHAAEHGAWGSPVRPRPGWRTVFATSDGMVRVYRVGAA